MKKCFIILFAASMCTCCAPCRQLATLRSDSVRVVREVNTVERLVPDTVWIDIPIQTALQHVRDTVSRLENDFATSCARINTDGTLWHELRAKAQRRAAPVLRREILTLRVDTVCIDRVRKDVVEVARPLTWWQRTQIKGFWLLLILVAVFLRRRIRGLVGRL